MTESDKSALRRLAGSREQSLGVDDLQGLLLQISLAIMMIFMIAFFMFRLKSEKEQQEQVLELTRQKLILACDRVAEEYAQRYEMPVYMTQSESGERIFKASTVIDGSSLTGAEPVRGAFVRGAKNAAADYADGGRLFRAWEERAVELAAPDEEAMTGEIKTWFKELLEERIAAMRARMMSVERACAAAIQRDWLSHPEAIEDGGLKDLVTKLKGADETTRLMLATEISESLRTGSITKFEQLTGAEALK